MTDPPVPARLTVLLARSADVGVVLRRGPSRWVRMIRWDTKGDLFVPGQWLNARVDDASLDLSPDGDKLVYVADNRNSESEYQIWTAVSRPPYFTALAFWPYPYGWDAGGYFIDDHTVRRWYHRDAEPPPPRGSRAPSQLRIDARPRGDDWCWYLDRGGWERAGDKPTSGGKLAETWRKSGRAGRGVIVRQQVPITRRATSRGRRTFTYQHLSPTGERSPLLDGAVWADWDRRGRLLFAREGKLYTADAADPKATPRLLIDLNPMTPEPMPAPAAVRRWK